MVISDKNARFIGGAAVLGIAAQSVIPKPGVPFALPGFDQAGIFGFYLPAVTGVLALFPGLIGNQKLLTGLLLAAIGGRAVFLQGRTALTVSNAAFAYAPLLAGVSLVA